MLLHRDEHYPIRRLCRLFVLPPSSYYYQAVETQEQVLRTAIEQVASEFPTYAGARWARRITQQLRRPPYQPVVNRKQVQRLMRVMKLVRPTKRRQQQTTDSQHAYPRYPNLVSDLAITHPDQVWVGDITYVRLRQDFVYLAVLMDVFTRRIRGWPLQRSLVQGLTLTALRKALTTAVPEIHHTDQGVQYAAHEYIALLEQHQVQISMAEVGEAWQNGYAERLIRTIKEEEIDLADYRDFTEAYTAIRHFIEQIYQHKRIGCPSGAALGYLTPVEFEAASQQQSGLRLL
jgi:putative transposase